MTDLVVEHVSKRYRFEQTIDEAGRRGSIGSRLRARRKRPGEFWALRDVSFAVERGETLGIIGDNGAGKSTMLKLLSSVTAPTSGQIVIRGRLSALIEVGSGFHPELTGRENVFLSGSILGMSRREIADKLERIVDFAGVREFIDTPVKRYSSGMYLRLGFSIAAHLEPDILLLDEVLAVGDAEFQAKCLERIHELHRRGRTIVFISHDLISVERLCRRVILLSHGRVIANGPARDVIGMYQEIGRTRAPSEAAPVPSAASPSRETEITAVTCHDAEGRETAVFRTGAAMSVRVSYATRVPLSDVVIELYFYTMFGGAYGPWCQLSTAGGVALEPGSGVVVFDVGELGLMPGECYVSARIARRDQPAGVSLDWRQECLWLRVESGARERGTFHMPHTWQVVPQPAVEPGVRAAPAGERVSTPAPGAAGAR